MARARLGAALRENAKSGSAAALTLVRQICLEVGRRLQAAGRIGDVQDVFHLSLLDVEAWLTGAWDGSGAGALAGDRQTRLAAQQELELPGVIMDSPTGGASRGTPGGTRRPYPSRTATRGTAWRRRRARPKAWPACCAPRMTAAACAATTCWWRPPPTQAGRRCSCVRPRW